MPLDLAVLLVSVPTWTRRNVFVVPPDARPHLPLTETIVLFGALSRQRTARRRARDDAHA